jgi:NitT/TauT family transport system permease protein
MSSLQWFAVRKELRPRTRLATAFMSFVLPLLVWSLVSYVPWIWHPKVEVIDPGGVSYFTRDMLVDREVFDAELATAREEHRALPTGRPANPIYLPAPHQVARAFYKAFTTEPKRHSEKWLHESLWESIQVIFWGFFLSSLFGVPLGILAGTYDFVSRLFEPFVEFFRYLPAPAFGALAVAILGIYHAPKIAIIFIGTFFQQVLVIANTTRKLDPSLLEAAQTLGAKNIALLFRVVIPGIVMDLSYCCGAHWHQFRHHLVHHPAGTLQEFRQRLRRDHDDRYSRLDHGSSARMAGQTYLSVAESRRESLTAGYKR